MIRYLFFKKCNRYVLLWNRSHISTFPVVFEMPGKSSLMGSKVNCSSPLKFAWMHIFTWMSFLPLCFIMWTVRPHSHQSLNMFKSCLVKHGLKLFPCKSCVLTQVDCKFNANSKTFWILFEFCVKKILSPSFPSLFFFHYFLKTWFN